MCGIFGIFNYNIEKGDIFNELIEGMKLIQHRGKDSYGLSFYNKEKDIIEYQKYLGPIKEFKKLNDSNKNETRSMRSKEEANDYRYFPDPDLLPLEVSDKFIDNIRSEIPELPDEKKKRLMHMISSLDFKIYVITNTVSLVKLM